MVSTCSIVCVLYVIKVHCKVLLQRNRSYRSSNQIVQPHIPDMQVGFVFFGDGGFFCVWFQMSQRLVGILCRTASVYDDAVSYDLHRLRGLWMPHHCHRLLRYEPSLDQAFHC